MMNLRRSTKVSAITCVHEQHQNSLNPHIHAHMPLYVQHVFFVFLWSLTYYFLLIFGHECLQREKRLL